MKTTMKTTMLILLLLASCLVLLAGCNMNTTPKVDPGAYTGKKLLMPADCPDVFVLTYEQHEYLLSQRGGLLHSESCPCHKVKTE